MPLLSRNVSIRDSGLPNSTSSPPQPHSGTGAGDNDPHNGPIIVKYRQGIQCIAFVDFIMALVMLSFLTFGFFPYRIEVVDKLREILGFVIFCLYTIQMMMALILFKGTNRVCPEEAIAHFKRWYSASNLINVMLFVEIYFFVFIVDGKTFSALILCFTKVFFRVLAMQIVSYSIRDYNNRLLANVLIAQRARASDSNHLLILGTLLDSIGMNNSRSTGGGGTSSTPAPPYEEIAPPSYDEAIKSNNNNNNTPTTAPDSSQGTTNRPTVSAGDDDLVKVEVVQNPK